MGKVVRAVDVGYGNTKYVVEVAGSEIRCATFPSVAYPSSSDPQATDRKTVALPIGGVFFEVGPEVYLAADNFSGIHLHDRYSETPQYMALLRGALHLMQVDHIDLLIVGLPVASFIARKEALEQAMTGVHPVGGGRSVTVAKALAVAQPHGALVYYATQAKRLVAMERELSLVIDPGSRTFDWLVARGMRFVLKKSHSVNRGMSDVLTAMAKEISSEIGEPYTNLQAIDVALRTGKNPIIYQQAFDIAHLMPVARSVAQQAVSSMLHWVEDGHSIQNIILSGGGAFIFLEAVKEAFPKHRIQQIKEPIYANVRGFQIAGMNLLLSQGQTLAVGGERHGT